VNVEAPTMSEVYIITDIDWELRMVLKIPFVV
jgi:hypothetical protein